MPNINCLPEGSFSWKVAIRHGSPVEHDSLESIHVFLLANPGALGLVPVRNKIVGTVPGSALFEQARIILEMWEPIELSLLGRWGVLPKRVYAHPVPLGIAAEFLLEQKMTGIPMPSTAAAIDAAILDADGAAIGESSESLHVLLSPFPDHRENATLFRLLTFDAKF